MSHSNPFHWITTRRDASKDHIIPHSLVSVRGERSQPQFEPSLPMDFPVIAKKLKEINIETSQNKEGKREEERGETVTVAGKMAQRNDPSEAVAHGTNPQVSDSRYLQPYPPQPFRRLPIPLLLPLLECIACYCKPQLQLHVMEWNPTCHDILSFLSRKSCGFAFTTVPTGRNTALGCQVRRAFLSTWLSTQS